MRTDLTPPEAAHQLLTKHHGVQRAAEVEAWSYANRYAPDAPERGMWVEVVRCIVDRHELPPVERREAPHPTVSLTPAA